MNKKIIIVVIMMFVVMTGVFALDEGTYKSQYVIRDGEAKVMDEGSIITVTVWPDNSISVVDPVSNNIYMFEENEITIDGGTYAMQDENVMWGFGHHESHDLVGMMRIKGSKTSYVFIFKKHN
jgi:hypothetical protein